MGEVNPLDHIIFDRRVEPRIIKRLHKDGGKIRVHCGNCLAGAVSDQLEEAMTERYQTIEDMPPCLYDRKTKELVRLGETKETYHEAMIKVIKGLMTDLDFDWLAKIETSTARVGKAMQTLIKVVVPNGRSTTSDNDSDAVPTRTPRTCN